MQIKDNVLSVNRSTSYWEKYARRSPIISNSYVSDNSIEKLYAFLILLKKFFIRDRKRESVTLLFL